MLWIDEISTLGITQLFDINHTSFREPRPQYILSGDFAQHKPFFNTLAGQPVTKMFDRSALLSELCGGNVLTMTQCGRTSDLDHFEFYASLSRPVAPGATAFCARMSPRPGGSTPSLKPQASSPERGWPRQILSYLTGSGLLSMRSVIWLTLRAARAPWS